MTNILEQQQKFFKFWCWTAALYLKKDTWWKKYHYIFYILSLLSTTLYLIVNVYGETNIQDIIEIVMFIGHFIVAIILWLILQLKKNVLFSNITALDYKYRDSVIRKIQEKLILKMSQSYRYKYLFLIIGTFDIVFITLIISKDLIAYQFSKKNNNPQYHFILPGRYHPWRINNDLKYYVFYFIELFLTLCPSIALSGVIYFIILFTYKVILQYRILFSALGVINERIIEKRGVCDRRVDIKCIIKRHNVKDRDNDIVIPLFECIDHHVNIIRSVGFFAALYTPIFITYLVNYLFLFVCGLYLLADKTYSSQRKIQKLFEFLAIFPVAVLLCYVGNILETKNNDLRNTLYDIQWYNSSIRFRKMIIFMLQNTVEEKNIRISLRMKASFTLLSSLIRVCYSCLNVFSKLLKNQ